jgi:hypothetical protein
MLRDRVGTLCTPLNVVKCRSLLFGYFSTFSEGGFKNHVFLSLLNFERFKVSKLDFWGVLVVDHVPLMALISDILPPFRREV